MKINRRSLFLTLIFGLTLGITPIAQGMGVFGLSKRRSTTQDAQQQTEEIDGNLLLKQMYMPQATKNLAQSLNLAEPHPIIKTVTNDALKTCGITEPVIVLQDEQSTNSKVSLNSGYTSLIVGVGDTRGAQPLPLIKHGVYHECGHIVNGDLSLQKIKILGEFGLMYTPGIYAAIKFNQATAHFLPIVPRWLGALTIAAISPFIIGATYKKTLWPYFERKKERRADIFAAQTLIHKRKEVAPCVCEFVDLMASVDKGTNNWKNEFRLFHDHPSYKERAELILTELKKAKIDFNALPIKQAELEHTQLTPEFLQKQFNAQVTKHFPKYLKNQSKS
jgi:hypothetical protein